MKSIILAAGMFLAGLSTAFAQTTAAIETPAKQLVIVDFESGDILFEKDAREPVDPASMSKLMTVEYIFHMLKSGQLTLDTEFQVSEYAWRTGGATSGGSTMFLDVGSSVSVENLLKGVIIQSGNDACIVLAEGVAGTEDAFAARLNDRAEALGLESAIFANSTGLTDADQKISVADLAALSAIIIREYPEYYPWFAERSFTWNGIKQDNRNPLLGVIDGADGLKTGHTEAAGYGLAASVERGGQRYIIVANGMESMSQRRSEMRRLSELAFVSFRNYSLFEAGDAVGDVTLHNAKADTVTVATAEDISITGLVASRSDLKVEIVYDGPVPAPISQGDEVAALVVTYPGRAPVSYPLLATESVGEKSFVGKLAAGIGGMFSGSEGE